MELLKLNKLNFIDIATIVIVFLFLGVGVAYYLHTPAKEMTRLVVTIEISDSAQVELIKDAAISERYAYLNSIDTPLASSANMDGSALFITLVGPGHIDANGLYYFNGQRILLGQKAEIHASYFAQGKVAKIEDVQ